MSSMSACTEACFSSERSSSRARVRSTGWPMRATLRIDMRESGDRDGAVQIDVLDRVQQPDALVHRALKRFAAGDQPHAARALVDDGRLHGFLQVGIT